MPLVSNKLRLVVVALAINVARSAEAAAPDFLGDVAPIFAKYCAGCHGAEEPEGRLSLENFAGIAAGGAGGAVLVPGSADASRLMRMLSGEIEPRMPPPDNQRPTDAEVEVLRAWIDAGARGPDGAEPKFPELTTPSLPHAPDAPEEISSLALAPSGARLALGKFRRVELRDANSGNIVASSAELTGKVNSVQFSPDGSRLIVASGIPGLYGVATVLNAADAATVREVRGHRDALYDAKLSPNGETLATCSHDRQIHLWNAASGDLVRTLAGHNGAVVRLAFSADSSLLASASADGTVKIWKVATGERLDTLGQAEGGQCTVAFSPDDKWIVAGGSDRQLRAWRLVSRESPRINPLVFSRSGHGSTVVELAFSPDGETLVSGSEGGELILWRAAELLPVRRYEQQPDLVTGIAFEPDGQHFRVARFDGSVQRYPSQQDRVPDESAPDNMPVVDRSPAASPAEVAPRREFAEQEPNDAPDAAGDIAAHSRVRGVIGAHDQAGAPDVDLYRFSARAGEQFVIEVNAARQKSPLDSHIEVLDAAGQSLPRVVLQAVRPTYFTFRGHDSTSLSDFRLHKWQDMELNEYLYANGEVSKLWMYPRGPDSGFLVYPGIEGNRYAYFGTTAMTHAVNEPCYIVEPHAPGSAIIPNGLPQYTIYFENDDDGRRQLGADSCIPFSAPTDGEYLVRVRDVRSLGGDEFNYELIVRPRQPDFKIKASAADLTINAGSGKEFSVFAERLDDFDGEIRIENAGLPPGFHATAPLVIQAGQNFAYGTITAETGAAAPPEGGPKIQLIASAEIGGKQVKKDPVELGEAKLAPAPKLLVRVLRKDRPAAPAGAAKDLVAGDVDAPVELEIAPGEMISAIVHIERKGYDGEVSLGGDHSGRNLPHGVFIDNIGLNGLTLLAGENEREFFITAAKWVPEQSRLFHLRTEVEGNQTSWPILLHVRRPSGVTGAEID
jgi:dipeptidyl aminopeptidase/acylaminoacyl peptidase